jgi:hypothetical protein
MTEVAIPATAVALAVPIAIVPTDVVSAEKRITPVKDVSMALVALS